MDCCWGTEYGDKVYSADDQASCREAATGAVVLGAGGVKALPLCDGHRVVVEQESDEIGESGLIRGR